MEDSMRRAAVGLMQVLVLGCGRSPAVASGDLGAQDDSLRTWVSGVQAAFDRFEGCSSEEARKFYAPDGLVMTTDSATMAVPGDALTQLFKSVACTRKESNFQLDSVIVRSLGPGVGVAAVTYLETATDTTNATNRLRGSVLWVLQSSREGWKASALAVTEHRTPVP
jgi:hypothetical protein